MEWEDWKKLGNHLKVARELVFKGRSLDERPKYKKRKWGRAERAIDTAKDLLDDLVFDDHPDRGDRELVGVFYGEGDREIFKTLNKLKKKLNQPHEN